MSAKIPVTMAIGASHMSAKIPVTMAIGAEAKMPASRRKTRKDVQLGDSAQAKVQIINIKKVPTIRFRRPYCSLSGAQTSGPFTKLLVNSCQGGLGDILTHHIT
jgi:hypothetical protein